MLVKVCLLLILIANLMFVYCFPVNKLYELNSRTLFALATAHTV